MLPGFRSLFVAVTLTISMLIFGLGAAALLRATHEEFASLSPKQTPDLTFGTGETQQPTLAVLQVDKPAAEPAPPEASQHEAQSAEAASPDARQETGAPAANTPTTDAPPATPTADTPAAPAEAAAADTTPANAPAPEPATGPGDEPVKAGEAVKPPGATTTPAAKSDAVPTDGKTSEAEETTTSPVKDDFKTPLPGQRPAEAAKTGDPVPSASKRSSAKTPRAAKRHSSHHHRHKNRHSHR